MSQEKSKEQVPVEASALRNDSVAASTDDEQQPQSRKDAPEFNEQTRYTSFGRIVIIFLACALVIAVALLDQTTLTVALPIIGEDLNAGSKATWFANGYFVTATALQLLYGRFSDIWSRKVVLLIGLPIFFFASLGASLAQTADQLIIFRAFAGVGGGGLITLSQIIISDTVTLRDRGKYQGILGSVIGLSNGLGPVIGGAISQASKESWRWIYRLNLFLAVFAAIGVIFFMPLRKVTGSKLEKLKAIDFTGAGLTLVSIVLIVIALTWAGSEYPWVSAEVLAPLFIGVTVFVAFIMYEYKIPRYPVMPLHVFKAKLVNGAMISSFVNGWMFYTQIFYIPQFLQILPRYQPVLAGALLIPLTVTTSISSTCCGLLISKTGRYREQIILGWALWAVASGLWSTCTASSGVGKYVGYSLMMGVGVGQTLQSTLVAVQAGVARRDMAVVTAMRNFARQLGGAFGLAVGTTILNNSVRSSLNKLRPALSSSDLQKILSQPIQSLSNTAADPRVHSALDRGYQSGFKILFYVNAGLASATVLAVYFLLPQVKLDRKDDADLKKAEQDRRRLKAEQKSKDDGEA